MTLVGHDRHLYPLCTHYGYLESIIRRIPLQNAIDSYDFDMIIPVSAEAVSIVSKYKPHLAVLPSQDSLDYCFNKNSTMKLADRLGIPRPKSFHVKSVTNLDQISLLYPCVVKPACETEMKGVYYAHNRNQIYHKISKSINSLLEKKEKSLPLINIYYLNRFINMRSHWPFWIWNLWRFAYLLYIVPMLRLRYKFSWRSGLWLLCINIVRDSNRLDDVDKGTFETLIRGNKFDAS